MGQAKARGTYAQRREQALERDALAAIERDNQAAAQRMVTTEVRKRRGKSRVSPLMLSMMIGSMAALQEDKPNE